jgi:hypothetical protein
MPTFLIVIGYLLATLIAISGLLRLLDISTDREDKERLKERIERFWMETAEIEFPARLQQALALRYSRTQALRFKFVKLFWLLCGLSIIATGLESLGNPAGMYRGIIDLNFGTRYSIHCSYTFMKANRDAADIKEYCDATKNLDIPAEFQHYRKEKVAYENAIDTLSKYPGLLAASAITAHLLTALIIVIPLSFALWASFNITLRLLSVVTRSRLYFLLVVGLDIAIALVMPPLLTSFAILFLVGGGVFALGQAPDFFAFSSANWFTLTLGLALFTLSLNYIFPVLGSLLAYVSGGVGMIVLALFALIAPIIMAQNRIPAFFVDAGKLIGGDFDTDTISLLIDWAIFCDLLFSATFLFPSLALVLANRSEASRKRFLNVTMWIHDHSKGPYVAISELLTDFLKVFSGK